MCPKQGLESSEVKCVFGKKRAFKRVYGGLKAISPGDRWSKRRAGRERKREKTVSQQ